MHNTPSEKLLVEHQWKRQIHNDIVVCSQSTDQSYQVKVFGIIFIQYSSLRVERGGREVEEEMERERSYLVSKPYKVRLLILIEHTKHWIEQFLDE